MMITRRSTNKSKKLKALSKQFLIKKWKIPAIMMILKISKTSSQPRLIITLINQTSTHPNSIRKMRRIITKNLRKSIKARKNQSNHKKIQPKKHLKISMMSTKKIFKRFRKLVKKLFPKSHKPQSTLPVKKRSRTSLESPFRRKMP